MSRLDLDALSRALATGMSRRDALKALAAGAALGLTGTSTAFAAPRGTNDCGKTTDTDSLWVKIRDEVARCVPAGDCAKQDIYPAQGYAVLQKPPNLLLVATARITGIECARLWGQGGTAPNYWNLAWTEVAKRDLKSRLGKIGMAINPKYGAPGHRIRDYDQLHIHVSCIKSSVQGHLKQNDGAIATTPGGWKASEQTLEGYTFRVLRLDSEADLAKENLFKLLRDHVATSDAEMLYQTLVVTQRPSGGFYAINSQGNLSHFAGTGAGEKTLLGEQC
jgi:CDP-diacylglycerol pyrophosphatase